MFFVKKKKNEANYANIAEIICTKNPEELEKFKYIYKEAEQKKNEKSLLEKLRDKLLNSHQSINSSKSMFYE